MTQWCICEEGVGGFLPLHIFFKTTNLQSRTLYTIKLYKTHYFNTPFEYTLLTNFFFLKYAIDMTQKLNIW